jgi:hypothetical protein
MSALSATFLRARNRKMYILRSAMLTHGARRAARLAGLLKKLPIVDASSDPAGNFLQAGEAALFTDDKNDPLTLRAPARALGALPRDSCITNSARRESAILSTDQGAAPRKGRR